MATLTPRMVAETMRQRLGLPDASQSARIINGIPDALKATGRVVAADMFLRPLLTTEQTTTTAVLTGGGTVDLTALYTTYHIFKEYFDKGAMYLDDGTGTDYLQIAPITAKARTFPQQFTDYNYYYIEGDTLYVQSASGGKAAGTLHFAVPYYPIAVSELSNSDELQAIFFDKLLEWCVDERIPGNDAAEDGEK